MLMRGSKGTNVQDWNQATNLVITDQAAGQIMGDWAQGEFQVAQEVAGTDYTCLPGMGMNAYISTGGDAFYFPKNDDPEIEAAQKRLAAQLVSPEVQVAFNLKKGSLPIRGDIDLSAANDCMKKGLEILAGGNIVPSGDMVWSADVQKQAEDLMVEFWKSDMAAADAHAKWVEILKTGL
jgi:glucose/mannose transport system substrate-binding protein